MNLADRLTFQARIRPASPAVIQGAGRIGFAQLDRLVWRCATRLHESGLTAGSTSVVLLGDELLLLVVTLACARLGATCVTIQPDTPDILLSEILARTRSDFVVCHPDDLARMRGARAIPADRAGMLAPAAIRQSIRAAEPRAPWLIVVGSGSTGRAKYFAIGHREFATCVRFCTESLALTADDRYASTMHLLYSSPKERGLATLFAGGALVLADRGREDTGVALARQGVTVFESTVFHADRLLRGTPQGDPGFGALRVLLLTASTVTEALRRRIVSRLTPNLWVRYGTNETGLIALCSPRDLFAAPGTVGRVHPGVELQVVGPDGDPVPTGGVGEVRVRTPAMVRAYLDDDESTRRAFRDGWFHPGDLAELTADGQLLFRGRADQTMIFNGNNIHPAHIESVVTSHPAVRDAVAFPLPSEASQDVPVCAVETEPGASLAEHELRTFCRDRLGPRTPQRFFLIARIPRNEQGKLVRADLLREIRGRA